MFFITVGAYLPVCKVARPICLPFKEPISFTYHHVLFVRLSHFNNFRKNKQIFPLKSKSRHHQHQIFAIKSYARGNTTAWPWTWSHYDPSKRREALAESQSGTSWMNLIFRGIAVRNSTSEYQKIKFVRYTNSLRIEGYVTRLCLPTCVIWGDGIQNWVSSVSVWQVTPLNGIQESDGKSMHIQHRMLRQ